MNKKFSTLLAAAALFGAVSANAAVDQTIKLSEAGNNTLYQIGITGGGFLTINEAGKLDTVNTVTSGNVASTLWCVTVNPENQGQNPKYDFLNKGTGLYLDVTMDGLEGLAATTITPDSVAVGGEIGGWAFSKVFANGVETEVPIYSYFSNDSIVALSMANDGRIGLVKQLGTAANVTALTSKFSLMVADSIGLNATEINTVLGTQDSKNGVNLTFTPDVIGTDLANPFKKGAFYTQDVTGEANHVYVLSKDSSYLAIDTTYTNKVGSAKFLNYKWHDLKGNKKGTHANAVDSIAVNALKEQFKYLFTYYPSNDSLIVRVKEVIFQKGNAPFLGTTPTDSVFVSLQELVAGKTRILTVDSVSQNTKISFGYTGCGAVVSNKTSVDDGLYYIMNDKGQYMTSLIHENGKAVNWATIKKDEQNVAHMPAFQWVLLKEKITAQAKPTSPMKGANREFTTKEFSYQLMQKPGAKYMYTGTSSDSLMLVKITDAAILGDTLLGYKNLTDNQLLVNTYTFNYLHPYTLEKFIAKSADSVLNVLDGKTAFSLVKGQNKAYGYDVAKAKSRIAGLKQLYRTNYKMYIPTVKSKLYVALAKENKFALSEYFGAAVDSFYFKENNQIGENCYHAMVKADAYNLADLKAGVADDDLEAILKQQVIGETRTSSFHITPFNTPLYRRFNSELEGVAGDASDTLRFVEKYRGEYLQIENNPNFILQKGIDYLGIYTAANAKSGLAFIVDTAWVNRGAGNIKPQYLISIERNDSKAAEGDKCPVCEALVAAGKPALANCPHDGKARLGFNRGKYLVNFQDSTTTAYRWKGYTRAGFVDAVNMGDSLYILVNDFKGMKNADVDTAKIIAAYTKAGINGKYIINLTGDNHKYVTWSMRYMDPTKTAEDKTFLMESMKAAGDMDIAPYQAAWLKMQNGCLVLSDPKASTFDKFTGGDDALIFDVKHVADDEVATDNESINTTVVSVVAGEGVVTIKNAANKTVAISNILGQTIANTVVTSDNATINVPAGLVVVSVEGEAAVKAIVR